MPGCIQGNPAFESLGIWLLLTSVIGFIAMGVDKARARGGDWRLPEMTLFAMALVGGFVGVSAGAAVFHHKTSKFSFLAVLFATVVVWLLVLRQIEFLGCLATVLP